MCLFCFFLLSKPRIRCNKCIWILRVHYTYSCIRSAQVYSWMHVKVRWSCFPILNCIRLQAYVKIQFITLVSASYWLLCTVLQQVCFCAGKPILSTVVKHRDVIFFVRDLAETHRKPPPGFRSQRHNYIFAFRANIFSCTCGFISSFSITNVLFVCVIMTFIRETCSKKNNGSMYCCITHI